jgi:hypothetical protein
MCRRACCLSVGEMRVFSEAHEPVAVVAAIILARLKTFGKHLQVAKLVFGRRPASRDCRQVRISLRGTRLLATPLPVTLPPHDFHTMVQVASLLNCCLVFVFICLLITRTCEYVRACSMQTSFGLFPPIKTFCCRLVYAAT